MCQHLERVLDIRQIVWFPLSDVERYVLQANVSRWTVRPWCRNSRGNSYLPRSSQRPCHLGFTGIIIKIAKKKYSHETSVITTRLVRISPCRWCLEVDRFHAPQPFQPSRCSYEANRSLPCQSRLRKSLWLVGDNGGETAQFSILPSLQNLGGTQLPAMT